MENFSCYQFTEWHSLANELSSYSLAIIIVSSILIVPTILLNSAVLSAIVRTRSLHTPQNIFMCNLAVSNIGLAFLGMPLSIALKVHEQYRHDNDAECLFTFLSYITCASFCGAAFITIAAATVDRFIALHLHLTYVSMVTDTKIIIVCVVVWLISLSLALLLLIGQYEYSIATSIGISFTMMIMGYCYLKIFHILRHHHNQIQSQITTSNSSFTNIPRYRKSVITLIYVLGIYISFYSPYLCSLVLLAFQGVSLFSLKLWSVGVLLMFVNSFVNPLFHCLKFEEIRIATQGTVRYFLPQLSSQTGVNQLPTVDN